MYSKIIFKFWALVVFCTTWAQFSASLPYLQSYYNILHANFGKGDASNFGRKLETVNYHQGIAANNKKWAKMRCLPFDEGSGPVVSRSLACFGLGDELTTTTPSSNSRRSHVRISSSPNFPVESRWIGDITSREDVTSRDEITRSWRDFPPEGKPVGDRTSAEDRMRWGESGVSFPECGVAYTTVQSNSNVHCFIFRRLV